MKKTAAATGGKPAKFRVGHRPFFSRAGKAPDPTRNRFGIQAALTEAEADQREMPAHLGLLSWLDAGSYAPETIRENDYVLSLIGLFAKCLQTRSEETAKAITGHHGEPVVVVERSGQEVVDVAPSHPWIELLASPSPTRMPPLGFYRWLVENYDRRGQAACLVVREGAGGGRVSLRPLFREWGELRYKTDGSYTWARADGQSFDLAAEDVVVIRRMHPEKPYADLSLFGMARYEIEADVAMSRFQRDTVTEGRFPPVVLSTEASMSDTALARVEEEFQRRYLKAGTYGGRFRVPVVQGKTNLHRVGMTSEDVSLIESRRLTDTHIFWLTGVPQGLFSDDANRANAEQAMTWFLSSTITNLVTEIASQLAWNLDRVFAFDAGRFSIRVPNLTPSDRAQDLKLAADQMAIGLKTANEILRETGEDEIGPVGDLRFVPSSWIPVNLVMDRSEEDRNSEPSPDDSGSGDDPEGEDDFLPGGDGAVSEVAIIRARRGRPSQTARKIIESRQKPLDRLERVARLEFRREAAMIRQLRTRIGATAPPASAASAITADTRGDLLIELDRLLDLDEMEARWIARFAPAVENALRTGFLTAVSIIPGWSAVFDPQRPIIQATTAAINGKIRDLVEETVRTLNRLIERGIERGDPVEEIVGTMLKRVEGMAVYRARRIAVTTVTGATEAAQHDAYQLAGIGEHMWNTSFLNSRSSHIEANGQVVPLGSTFLVGASMLKHPGDPAGPAEEVINCQCAATPVL